MSRILAAVDGGPVTAAVVKGAEALLPALGDSIEVVTVGSTPVLDQAINGHRLRRLMGDPVESLVDAVSAENVTALVVGARSMVGGPRPVGHVTLQLITSVAVPVVVIPPEVGPGHDPLSCVLLPLEGGLAPSTTTARIVDALVAAGARLQPVHVFDRTTAPSFWDRFEDAELYADQFSRRYAPGGTATELRAGDAAQQILAASNDVGATLIVLEWKALLGGTHAPVVSTLLCNADVPLVLIPVAGDSDVLDKEEGE